jgi:hypothetical protein
MAERITRRWCPRCEMRVKALRQQPNHILHLLLSLLTLGFWVLAWLLVSMNRDWRCSECGATTRANPSRQQVRAIEAKQAGKPVPRQLPLAPLVVLAIAGVVVGLPLVVDACEGPPRRSAEGARQTTSSAVTVSEPSRSARAPMQVAVSMANLRKGHSASSTVEARLPLGCRVKPIREFADWTFVELLQECLGPDGAGSHEGWLATRLLEPVSAGTAQ